MIKRTIMVIVALIAVLSPLSAQTKYCAEVDSLVAVAPAYNEYNEMKRGLFKVIPTSTDDIIFFGDSITDRCEWAELFENPNIKNRGISGDRVRWMFDRYRQTAEGHPAKLFFLAGINDLNAKTKSHDVVIMIAELLTRFRAYSPETKIYVQSILPMNLDAPAQEKRRGSTINERIDNCNKWLQEWCSKNDMTFINIAPAMKQADGQLNEVFTIDGLHPNAIGYMVWKDIIEGYVEE